MNKRTGLIVVALIVGLAVDLAESKTIYVKVGGTGDGSSWAAAFGDLQRALDDADPNDEIWVAAGTYIPTYDYNLDIGDRGKHFEMINGVGIYGGFPDTADPVWADRDPNTWESILSGDLAGNDEPSLIPKTCSGILTDQRTAIMSSCIRDSLILIRMPCWMGSPLREATPMAPESATRGAECTTTTTIRQ